MAEELTYALITPYSLLKSRTGGIIGRLLSLAKLEFIGAHMYAPSDEFVNRYCGTLHEQDMKPRYREALEAYIDKNFRKKNPFGITNRTMLLLFKGEQAIQTLKDNVVGPISDELKGDTVRGTYGDFIQRPDGDVEYFEPAVITSGDPVTARKQLRLLADYAETDGGVLEDVVPFAPGVEPETTLAIVKPDNFRKRSSRPGNVVDMFSRTGLFIVGAKLLRLSVAQAEEFYWPVREALVEKLKGAVVSRLQEAFGERFSFVPGDRVLSEMADLVKEQNAECEFNNIVEYMTGIDRSKIVSPDEKKKPGTEKCLALLYQGEGAIRKIRERLGATDPEKAEEGTVRSIYGYDLMKNVAHASDSPENAERERKIVGLWREQAECDVKTMIEEYLGRVGA